MILMILKTLNTHRTTKNLSSPFQSAYCKHHFTETALPKVHIDLLEALGRGECILLMLLDLGAAFYTVDHTRLAIHMEKDFGISKDALQWLKSYLSDRKQAATVRVTVRG